jgi:hypothetical protein
MTRYFFHLEDGADVLRDEIGEEFGTIEEARSHAAQVVKELGRGRPERTKDQRTLLVTDVAGVVLFRLPFLFNF